MGRSHLRFILERIESFHSLLIFVLLKLCFCCLSGTFARNFPKLPPQQQIHYYYSYYSSPDGLEQYRFNQTDRDQKQKETARETKKNLKDIKAKGPDGLEAYRFEQTEKGQEWKKKGRDQIKENAQFDMARSLFGGGGGEGGEEEEEE